MQTKILLKLNQLLRMKKRNQLLKKPHKKKHLLAKILISRKLQRKNLKDKEREKAGEHLEREEG